MAYYKFWMVYDSGKLQDKQYFVESEAIDHAQWLAKDGDRPVYVLEAMSGYDTPEPKVVKFTTERVPLAVNGKDL